MYCFNGFYNPRFFLGSILYFSALVTSHAEKPATVSERLVQLKDVVQQRIKPRFDKADAPYPPKRLVLYGLKREQRLQVFAPDRSGRLRFIYQYPVPALRPEPGPKLEEGDMMTPEGIYRVTFLNPNSTFYLGMEISYPNDFDKKMGKADKRKSLGHSIVIHGNRYSDGCLAMGDTAMEDLFTLSALTGRKNIKVILVPYDLRNEPDTSEIEKEYPKLKWLPKLYEELRSEVNVMENTGTDTELALLTYPDAAPPEEESLIMKLLKLLLTPAQNTPTTTSTVDSQSTQTAETP